MHMVSGSRRLATNGDHEEDRSFCLIYTDMLHDTLHVDLSCVDDQHIYYRVVRSERMYVPKKSKYALNS